MTSVAEWIVSANNVGEPVVRNPNSLDAVMMLLVAIDTLTDFDMAAPAVASPYPVFGACAPRRVAATRPSMTSLLRLLGGRSNSHGMSA